MYREIERLRGVAIWAVFNCHFFSCWVRPESVRQPLRDWLIGQWTGVDLFFVISGFVITQSLLRDLGPADSIAGPLDRLMAASRPIAAYLGRRVLRLVPAAACWLVIAWGYALVFAEPYVSRQVAQAALSFVSMRYNYDLVQHASLPPFFGQFWSLSVEQHFFVLAPFVLLIVRGRRTRVVAAFGVVAYVFVVARVFGILFGGPYSPDAPLWFLSQRRIDTLFVGMILALMLPPLVAVSRTSLSSRWLRMTAVVTLCALMLSGQVVLRSPFWIRFGQNLYAICSLVLVFIAALDRGILFGSGRLARFLEFLGARSYSFYLCHLFIGQIIFSAWPLGGADGPIEIALKYVLTLGTVLICSHLTYMFVEKPFIALGKQYSSREPLLTGA